MDYSSYEQQFTQNDQLDAYEEETFKQEDYTNFDGIQCAPHIEKRLVSMQDMLPTLCPDVERFKENCNFLNEKQLQENEHLSHDEKVDKLRTILYNDAYSQYSSKIYGMIYGLAIGDSIGLLTARMCVNEINKAYGKLIMENKGKLLHKFLLRDMFRNDYRIGSFSSITDEMILLMQSLLKISYSEDSINVSDYVQRLSNWKITGYLEFCDFKNTSRYNLFDFMNNVIDRNDLITLLYQEGNSLNYQNICFSIRKQYAQEKQKHCKNIVNAEIIDDTSGIMLTRCTLIAISYNKSILINQVLKFISVFTNHAESQCCCLAYTLILNTLLYGSNQNGQVSIPEILDNCVSETISLYEKIVKEIKIKQNVEHKVLDKTILRKILLYVPKTFDEIATSSPYEIFRTFNICKYALFQTNYEKTITEIALLGGYMANLNCAVAGVILGAKYGIGVAIPPCWHLNLSVNYEEILAKNTRRFMEVVFQNVYAKYLEH